jgi:hypothetical protein
MMINHYQFGRSLMVLAAVIAITGFFSLSYNHRQGVLENVFKGKIDVVSTRCLDENGNGSTGEYNFSPYKDPNCAHRFDIPYKGVILFSSVMLFLGFYFFTAKQDEAGSLSGQNSDTSERCAAIKPKRQARLYGCRSRLLA